MNEKITYRYEKAMYELLQIYVVEKNQNLLINSINLFCECKMTLGITL